MQLTLFFTRGNGLEDWDKLGTLSREVAIYQQLQECDLGVHFITYGKNDLKYQTQLPNIHIHTNRFIPDKRFYPRLIPIIHGRILFNTDVIKTNQLSGAKFAIQAGKLFNKPVIVRQGYSWSHNRTKTLGELHPRIATIRQTENRVYTQASHIIVTSQTQRDQIIHCLPHIENKISVIPNYVDTDIFAPQKAEKIYDLIAVGRLSDEKNTVNLIQTVQSLKSISLLLIGDGSLAQYVQQCTVQNPNVTWIKRVANNDLPLYYNQARAFILPSLYEGMPKVLLEAMSCGLPVIGTNVTGIREVIEHRENGWLCEGTDVRSLKSAIHTVLADEELQQYLGRNARQSILNQYALNHLADREYELIKQVVKR